MAKILNRLSIYLMSEISPLPAALAAVPADAVANIPGFGAPLSKLYSGYLAGGTGKHAHYMFSESLRHPASDDLVVWFNGGPGCSSLEGAFSE
jgi:carboxypeptidase C (cathepsin A)